MTGIIECRWIGGDFMSFFVLPLIMILSFEIGPTIGAFVPVQDEGDPWGTSFIFGVKARYGLHFMDLDCELQFTELNIDPDSSRGFNYAMVPLSLGASRKMLGLRLGAGGALYAIEATTEIGEELNAVWKGTYPGAYISFGKDFTLFSGTADLSAKFNIINFDGLWVGLTSSILF